jgi:hypothetical protein
MACKRLKHKFNSYFFLVSLGLGAGIHANTTSRLGILVAIHK